MTPRSKREEKACYGKKTRRGGGRVGEKGCLWVDNKEEVGGGTVDETAYLWGDHQKYILSGGGGVGRTGYIGIHIY